MTLCTVLGVVAYLAIGIFTGIVFLVARGKDVANTWRGRIDMTAFDEEDALLAVIIILFWPFIWLLFSVIKFILAVEKYIVVPIVNKNNKKRDKNEV